MCIICINQKEKSNLHGRSPVFALKFILFFYIYNLRALKHVTHIFKNKMSFFVATIKKTYFYDTKLTQLFLVLLLLKQYLVQVNII